MKVSRYNKALGLAVGERSICVAEVLAASSGGGGGGSRVQPDARRMIEFSFPVGVSLNDPAGLGAALGQFLREQRFAARSAVVGLPAKWLLVKSKEVPPAGPEVVADMLRLQAEGEFSSELKDLVFDYAGDPNASGSRNVLLVATPRRYVELAERLCEAARLELVAVTASAAVLGTVTAHAAGSKNTVVLTVAAAGAELAAQSGGHTSALRHLRGPAPESLFLSDLRRAVSTLPSTNGSAASNGGITGAREMIVWDATEGVDREAAALGDSLGGLSVRNGDLPLLGVTTTEASRNGGGRKYAAAVALALSAIGEGPAAPIDFLHSRLAPPKPQRIAPWMIWSAAAALILIAGLVVGYLDLDLKEKKLADIQTHYKAEEKAIASADAFVTKVSFAQGWHGGDPRYLACLRDMTLLVPDDGQIYVTSLILRNKDPGKVDPTKGASAATKAAAEARHIVVNVVGKAPTQKDALELYKRFQSKKGLFVDLKQFSTQPAGGRSQEVTFSFACEYVPADKPAASARMATDKK